MPNVLWVDRGRFVACGLDALTQACRVETDNLRLTYRFGCDKTFSIRRQCRCTPSIKECFRCFIALLHSKQRQGYDTIAAIGSDKWRKLDINFFEAAERI